MRITPRQFSRVVSGYYWKEERIWDRLGFLAAMMYNTSGFAKKSKEAKDVLGREIGQSKVPAYKHWR